VTGRPKKVALICWYQLPTSIGVTAGCFGKTVKIEIAGRSGTAVLPQLDWSGEKPRVVAPTMPAEILRHVDHYDHVPDEPDDMFYHWGSVRSWRPLRRIVGPAYVDVVILRFGAVAAEITYSEHRRGRGSPMGPVVDALFSNIDAWFDRFRTWLEVSVDQDLDPDHPISPTKIRGEGLHILTDDGGLLSLPASSMSITALFGGVTQSVTLPLLRRAAKQSSEGRSPSAVHLLLRDGRAAFRRHQFRRAVIEAGSAVELTLADFNRTVTKVTTRKPTLGWYTQQPAIAARAHLPANLRAGLVDVRNAAIHNNVTPTRDKARRALELATRVVRSVDPLPL
jgi:hypothetical protein